MDSSKGPTTLAEYADLTGKDMQEGSRRAVLGAMYDEAPEVARETRLSVPEVRAWIRDQLAQLDAE